MAKELKIKIPDEVTVVGYDNLKEAQTVSPGLTTIHTPLIEMGITGVNRLLQKQAEKNSGYKTTQKIVLPGKIILRESHKYLN